MQQSKRPSGITLRYPDATRLVTGRRPAAPGPRRATRRGAPGLASPSAIDGALDDLFKSEGISTIDEIELETTSARAVRSAPAGERSASIDVEVGPGESAAVLLEQDGLYTWALPRAGGGRRTARRTRAGHAETLTCDILLAPGASRDRRGLASWAGPVVGWVKAKVLKFAAAVALDSAMKLLERNVSRGLVHITGDDPQSWSCVPDVSALGLPDDRAPRILWMVHGTFSSTVGSYGGLGASPWGKLLLGSMLERYDAIVGFDHPTLSQTPEDNAIELLRLLEAHDWKHAPVFDAVAFSRGGMVARSLIEALLPGSRLVDRFPGTRFERVVFVGATNGGTQLAEPENWHELVDLYTNLAVAAARVFALLPGTPPISALVGEGLKSVASLVKYLATEAVDRGGVPGLAAMEPDGEFVQRLNRTQPGQPGANEIDYHAVVSDFEPRGRSAGVFDELPRRLVTALADRFADRLMRVDNDLVVDTESMTTIDSPDSGLLKSVLDFGTNGNVYHLVYFTQQKVGEALGKWLVLPAAKVRRGARAEPTILPQFDAEIRAPREAERAPRRPSVATAAAGRPRLEIEVVWEDIREAEGDVFAVGHYRGVLPQKAELALDRAISGIEPGENKGERGSEDLVLTRMTRRSLLQGQVGEIRFFPRDGDRASDRLVTICGMGFPGSFNPADLRRLHCNLAMSLMALPLERMLCTCLIGSGEGSLGTEDSLTGLLRGFGDAMRAGGGRSEIKRIRIAELLKQRAEEIHDTLKELIEKEGNALPMEVVLTSRAPKIGRHGLVEDRYCLEVLANAAHRAKANASIGELVKKIGRIRGRQQVVRAVKHLWSKHGSLDKIAVTVLEPPKRKPRDTDIDRISFFREGRQVRAASIATEGATVPERVIEVDPALLDEAARRMTDPHPDDLTPMSRLLHGLVLPRAFRSLVNNTVPLVVEVDRNMAPIHWEMMASRVEDRTFSEARLPDAEGPIGLKRPVSRQIRTTYSPPPTRQAYRSGRKLRALVIGDPGDPDRGESLPGARREAKAVARLLRKSPEFDQVHVMIGALDGQTSGTRQPATRIDVLSLLLNEAIDLVHYAGHADFDPDDPTSTGWLFKDGLLRAAEVSRIDRVPPVIVANACLSARTANVDAGARGDERRERASLLPSLADEFFRRGVLNYIGTAWEIDDQGAIDFAKHLYRALLEEGASIGQAMLRARKLLADQGDGESTLWAAYQHYGDPNFTVKDL